jgi:hypothetical protein
VAGVPAKVVSEQLGHASSAFTLDVYSHVLPHMQSEAALRVEALLGMAGQQQAGNLTGARKPPQSIRPGTVNILRSNAKGLHTLGTPSNLTQDCKPNTLSRNLFNS